MTTVSAYLTFDGQTEEAFNFYKSVFGGEFSAIHKFSGIPGMENISDEDRNRIMHVSLPIGNTILMASDTMSGRGQKVDAGNNFTLAIDPENKSEADRIFNALSEGGKVTQPMENSFWGSYFGMFTDKFGIQWMIDMDLSKGE